MSTYPDYESFFRKATGGLSPLPYQQALATQGELPGIVSIPTGLGKTAAVILGWVWRRQFSSADTRSNTPRRLVYCLPMRVLVEQVRDEARKWLTNLQLLATDAPVQHSSKQIAVHTLMGGDLEIDWDRWPDRDQILIGTQDMLLSRALNRGYAMSRFRWPVHYALLNNDCLWVCDETQLMGDGLATTAQLQAFRRKLGAFGSTRTLWMSATIDAGAVRTIDFDQQQDCGPRLSLSPGDKASAVVHQRISASKPLEKASFSASKDGKPEADLILREHAPESRTLVIVNTVRRAQAIFRALMKKKSKARILMLHSRFRREDRERILTELQRDPIGAGTIGVCTQVLEAGVDISCRRLITDIAPMSSMIQRFGRCNRRGEFGASSPAKVTWIGVASYTDQKLCHPYVLEEVEAAARTLDGMEDAKSSGLPAVSASAEFTHVIRRKDALELFDTTPDLCGQDVDVSRFIREENTHDIHVFWRDIAEGEAPSDEEPRPARDEICAVPVGQFRDWHTEGPRRTAWRWDHVAKGWVRSDRGGIYPGQTLMLRACDGGYDPEMGWTGDPGSSTSVVSPGLVPPPHHDDDPRCVAGAWVTIAAHTNHVVRALDEILAGLSLQDIDHYRSALQESARWHDLGKAHHVFQNAVPQQGNTQGREWAKWPGRASRYERPNFRHELASALAMLQNNLGDLAAYLAASHHGKIRLSVRPLPASVGAGATDDRCIRGICDGDYLPSIDLGDGVVAPETTLRSSYLSLGEHPQTGASWVERCLDLRDDPSLGPFRLAFLEAVLRVSDWRASAPISGTRGVQS